MLQLGVVVRGYVVASTGTGLTRVVCPCCERCAYVADASVTELARTMGARAAAREMMLRALEAIGEEGCLASRGAAERDRRRRPEAN